MLTNTEFCIRMALEEQTLRVSSMKLFQDFLNLVSHMIRFNLIGRFKDLMGLFPVVKLVPESVA